MANIYYNAASDTAWDELGNWWNDEAFTDPAVALPASGDTVYLSGDMDSGPSTTVTLNHIYAFSGFVSFNGAIGNATFDFSSALRGTGTVTGDATFSSDAVNFGTVTGNAEFYVGSFNGGTVAGDAAFADYGYNGGTVTGDATFGGECYNSGTVTGNATFSATSYNNGTVTGDAAFNGFSYNSNTVTGNATFRNSSRNTGTIEENATVYYDGGDGEKPIGGTVNGTVTYVDFPVVAGVYYNNSTDDSAWDTIANWWVDASFTIPALDLPLANTDVYLGAQMTSGPSVPITLNYIYIARSGGNFGVRFTGAAGPAEFFNGSYNLGTINGTALFNAPETYNAGTVTGTATFFGIDGNSGTCSGNAFFNDTTTNIGTVTGKATFSLTAAVSQIKTYSGVTQGTFGGDVVISAGSDQTIARLLKLPWFINL